MKQHRFDKNFQAIMEAVNDVYNPIEEDLINEAKKLSPEERLKAFQDVVDNGYKKIEGQMVDSFTASMLLQVAKALKPDIRDKWLSEPSLKKMVNIGWKVTKK